MRLLSLIILVLFSNKLINAQCCTATKNLIINGDFSAPIGNSKPIGFRTGNEYSKDYRGPGLYAIISSRSYGTCYNSPQFDKTKNDTSGQYLWYDTSMGNGIDVDTAWQPYFSYKLDSDTSLIDVKQNTYYTFSFWVRDIGRALCAESEEAPIIAAKINGIRLKVVDLGLYFSPCCPDWINVCIDWYSGTFNKAGIMIESLRHEGNTDLGIDEVYFGERDPIVKLVGSNRINCNETIEIETNLEIGTFEWNTNEINSRISINEPGKYWLNLNKNICGYKLDTFLISKDEFTEFKIGNVFTPNDDNLNEVFKPLIDCEAKEYSLRIYNRWGIELFLSTEKDQGWDGRYKGEKVPDGTYYYIIQYKDYKNREQKIAGITTKITQ